MSTITLEQLTALYSTVLIQLLPIGLYDKAHITLIAKDIRAHAKVFAQADLNGKRLLKAIDSIPLELLKEYEQEYGLPLKCTNNSILSEAERRERITWAITEKNLFNREYVINLFSMFGLNVIDIVNYVPLQCTQATCLSAVNPTEMRYKVRVDIQAPITADTVCIIKNYLPAFLQINVMEV